MASPRQNRSAVDTIALSRHTLIAVQLVLHQHHTQSRRQTHVVIQGKLAYLEGSHFQGLQSSLAGHLQVQLLWDLQRPGNGKRYPCLPMLSPMDGSG